MRFRSDTYNTIFSINTIHHFLRAYSVVHELIRVLAADGKLVLSDFSSEGFDLMDSIHAMEGKVYEVMHVTLAEIEKDLYQRGFMIQKHQTRFQEIVVASGAIGRPFQGKNEKILLEK